MNKPDVSVIVPIYGVEMYIEKCARSLFEQTLPGVEFIFVNDKTVDRSIELLNLIIHEYNAFDKAIIIHHDINLGLPTARNTGLKIARGKYIYHCDSDDYLENNALELFYQKAKTENADIVWSDYYLTFEKNERYMSQSIESFNDKSQHHEVLRALLTGKLKYNVWNKLIKRSLYLENKIEFPDGNGMGEDMTIIKLFVHAQNIAYLPTATYHYIQLNSGAFTKSINQDKLNQLMRNVLDLQEYINKYVTLDIAEYLHYFKLNTKLPFLISLEVDSYERWNEWFIDSNPFINNKHIFNYRIRLIQKFALKRQYWLLKLYNILIVKVIYGVIYR